MSKKNRKQYTAEQKYNYHSKRATDKTISENQRLYSKHWVNGFLDDYAEQNLKATQAEYNRNKKYMGNGAKAVYQGEINGTRAAVNDKAAAHKIKYETKK